MENLMKVKHPKYGHVIFSSPTDRQKDILQEYNKITKQLEELRELTREYPNDFTFGTKVRKILNR